MYPVASPQKSLKYRVDHLISKRIPRNNGPRPSFLPLQVSSYFRVHGEFEFAANSKRVHRYTATLLSGIRYC
ncbi:unnamed protein product, partial [Rotaria socialis]